MKSERSLNLQQHVLPPSQIIIYFDFSRYIYFATYLDVHYV
jgi:hypothetical protein